MSDIGVLELAWYVARTLTVSCNGLVFCNLLAISLFAWIGNYIRDAVRNWAAFYQQSVNNMGEFWTTDLNFKIDFASQDFGIQLVYVNHHFTILSANGNILSYQLPQRNRLYVFALQNWMFVPWSYVSKINAFFNPSGNLHHVFLFGKRLHMLCPEFCIDVCLCW